MHRAEAPLVPMMGEGETSHSAVQRPSRDVMETRVRDMLHGVSCATCGKHFASRPLLLVHQSVHTRLRGIMKKPRKLQETAICPVCGEQSSTLTVLTKHFLRKHVKQVSFPCAKCAKAFDTKSDAVQHQKLCLKGPDVGKVFRCLACHMIRRTAASWREHAQLTSHRTFELCWPDGSFAEGLGAREALLPKDFGTVLEDEEVAAAHGDPYLEDEAVVVHVGAFGG